MAFKKEVVEDFTIEGKLSFKKGDVKSFSDEICKKYAQYLKDTKKAATKKTKKEE